MVLGLLDQFDGGEDIFGLGEFHGRRAVVHVPVRQKAHLFDGPEEFVQALVLIPEEDVRPPGSCGDILEQDLSGVDEVGRKEHPGQQGQQDLRVFEIEDEFGDVQARPSVVLRLGWNRFWYILTSSCAK
jgi:hypothetical protein